MVICFPPHVTLGDKRFTPSTRRSNIPHRVSPVIGVNIIGVLIVIAATGVIVIVVILVATIFIVTVVTVVTFAVALVIVITGIVIAIILLFLRRSSFPGPPFLSLPPWEAGRLPEISPSLKLLLASPEEEKGLLAIS